MRILLQRVQSASVTINKEEKRSISKGLCIFLGIEEADETSDIDWAVRKIANMRIFPDADGVMNESIMDQKGEFLVISQFTLHASTKKGNRPSYLKAAKPAISIPLYETFLKTLHNETSLIVQSGEFGADMLVEINNDGPVTIWLDTKNKE